MGRQSTISENPAIRDAVDKALNRGCTLDAIVQMISEMGAEISRSAVGRYAGKFRDQVERQRAINSAAQAFANEFGSIDNKQTRLMVQLLTTLITEKIMNAGEGEGTALDLRLLAAAVKDALGAAKIDHDLLAAMRKQVREECQEAAERALASTGATEAQMEALRREFLGLPT